MQTKRKQDCIHQTAKTPLSEKLCAHVVKIIHSVKCDSKEAFRLLKNKKDENMLKNRHYSHRKTPRLVFAGWGQESKAKSRPRDDDNVSINENYTKKIKLSLPEASELQNIAPSFQDQVISGAQNSTRDCVELSPCNFDKNLTKEMNASSNKQDDDNSLCTINTNLTDDGVDNEGSAESCYVDEENPINKKCAVKEVLLVNVVPIVILNNDPQKTPEVTSEMVSGHCSTVIAEEYLDFDWRLSMALASSRKEVLAQKCRAMSQKRRFLSQKCKRLCVVSLIVTSSAIYAYNILRVIDIPERVESSHVSASLYEAKFLDKKTDLTQPGTVFPLTETCI